LGLVAAFVVLFVLYFALPLPFIAPADDVSEIEGWAAKNACVESLDKWSRTYQFYGALSPSPDFSKIVFTFTDPAISEPEGGTREAGIHRPWRQSLVFGKSIIDDRPQRYARGVFDRKSGKVVEWSCGCNVNRGEEWATLPICPDS